MQVWQRVNKRVAHILSIGILSLGIGILSNWGRSDGIHPRELLMLFPFYYHADFQTVSVDSAIYMMFEEEVVFIDIRSSDDFKIDHIPNAVSLPFRQYIRQPSKIQSIMDDKPLLLYDFRPNCKETFLMARMMKKQGAQKVLILKEGFAGWIEENMPVERPELIG